MQRFLEVGVKGLRGLVDWYFLSTMHVMKETIASSKRAAGKCNMIEKGVADLEESFGIVCSIVIFCIWSFCHILSQEGAVIWIMQNMVLVNGAQLFNREVVQFVVYDNVVKNVANFEGLIEASGSTIVEVDG